MTRHHSVPCHKRLSRQSRLQAVKQWLAQYPGANILRGYSKHFGVDFECALKELTLLGIPVDAQYINQRRQSLRAQSEHRRNKRKAPCSEIQDDHDKWLWCFQALGMDFTVHEEPWRDTGEPRNIFGDKPLGISDKLPLDPDWD